LPRRRSQLKREFKRWLGKPPRNQVASHPWGYLAEIVSGSQGPAAEQQLEHWLQHGFQVHELARFSALPAARPAAQAWQAASAEPVAIQLRGGELDAAAARTWLAHCPIQAEVTIEVVPFGGPQRSAVALNLADVVPGPQGTAELLQLAQCERVWDPIPSRVQLLRQLGVQASWLMMG
jgi:hypothetical protein